MLKTRLIPCLLLQNGNLVRSERFSFHQVLGDPTHEVSRYDEWQIDELIYLDISKTSDIAPRRDVKRMVPKDPLAILEDIAKHCRVPLTFGGGIRTLADIEARLARGADKVTLNTSVLERPSFLVEAAKTFGRQCLVVSIDAKITANGFEVFSHLGSQGTGRKAREWAREVEGLGAGEIFLNSIDRDGKGTGYDLDLIRSVTEVVGIPVIVCGGVGDFSHFAEGVRAGASAVSAANIFHFTELSNSAAKRALQAAGIEVRI